MRRHVPLAAAALTGLLALWAAGRKTPEEGARGGRSVILGSVGFGTVLALSALALLPCHPRATKTMRTYGCAGCHTVPGMADANGTVGPPLKGLANRTFVAGGVRNDARAVAAWVIDPPRYDPNTAMPRTGISPEEARDVVDYLYRH